jgi:hypothetical protein
VNSERRTVNDNGDFTTEAQRTRSSDKKGLGYLVI